jgi:uncharacterized protein (DUF4415 family)
MRSAPIQRDELSPELQAELDALNALTDDSIDIDDIPEASLSNMMQGDRGLYFRPVKTSVTIRLDADLLDWYKSHAENGKYQTEINRALRLYMQDAMKKAG